MRWSTDLCFLEPHGAENPHERNGKYCAEQKDEEWNASCSLKRWDRFVWSSSCLFHFAKSKYVNKKNLNFLMQNRCLLELMTVKEHIIIIYQVSLCTTFQTCRVDRHIEGDQISSAVLSWKAVSSLCIKPLWSVPLSEWFLHIFAFVQSNIFFEGEGAKTFPSHRMCVIFPA